jgi:hypothetical protein
MQSLDTTNAGTSAHSDKNIAPAAEDREEAERFLELLDPDVDGFTFQTFDDDRDRKDETLVRVFNGTLDQHWRKLCNLNAEGAGIYVTVNRTDGKGRTAKNIVEIRALFVDLDGAPLDPVTQYKLPPHFVVESSPGKFHAYWRVSDVTLELFEDVQKGCHPTDLETSPHRFRLRSMHRLPRWDPDPRDGWKHPMR